MVDGNRVLGKVEPTGFSLWYQDVSCAIFQFGGNPLERFLEIGNLNGTRFGGGFNGQPKGK